MAMQTEIVRVTTADGARLALKRRAGRPGAPPVLLIHGLAMNADIWNFPDVRGPDFHYRSLATVLCEAGFDVWLLNLRGHGAPQMLSEPPPGQADWSVDHFILYDVPAAIECVRATAGRRPFVLAASMGAISLAGHLQGAHFTSAAPQIRASAELALERAEQLAGAVFVEFPAALRWPQSLYDAGGRLQWTLLADRIAAADGNYPFEVLARSAWIRAILDAMGVIPLKWLRPTATGQAIKAALPAALRGAVEKLERGTTAALLKATEAVMGPGNDRVEVILHGWRHTVDHMKAGVMQQFAKCVRQGSIVSTLGTPDHVYSDFYQHVCTPTLVLAGGRDRIAHPQITREVFFERVAHADKTFLLFEEINHGDFEATPYACERVYPQVAAWLQARAIRGV